MNLAELQAYRALWYRAVAAFDEGVMSLPPKVAEQIRKAGLPTSGTEPFRPKLTCNQKGEQIIEKRAVSKCPKQGKRGYVDDQERIWIRDRAHAHVPDHWDVQIDGGDSYIRVDNDGNLLP